MKKKLKYGCADYRDERILLSLKKRLNENDLSKEERIEIKSHIWELEKEMGLD